MPAVTLHSSGWEAGGCLGSPAAGGGSVSALRSGVFM